MEIVKEKLLEYYPKPISIEENEKILEQMKSNGTCKIYGQNKGNGFFTKIPFPDDENLLPVLITNNHIIDESYLKNNKEIIISQDDDNRIQLVLKNRIIYTNEKYDITIIEIKENKDNIKYFLELDKNINLNSSYFSESIYILQYFSFNNLTVSFGITKQMGIKTENNFIHFCNTDQGSSGSPLLLLSTNKVIAIHIGCSKYNNYNIGLFLNEPIIDFNRQNRDKMKQIKNKKPIDLNIKKKPNERTSLDLNNFWNIKKFIMII